jgi:hypothetical protein
MFSEKPDIIRAPFFLSPGAGFDLARVGSLKTSLSLIELRAKNKDYDCNDNRNKKEANQPCGKQLPLFQDFNPYGDSRYSYESEDASHLVTQDMDT